MTKKPSALSGALAAGAAILAVAAFSSGLLFLDRMIEGPFVVTAAASASPVQLPTDAEIGRILADRVDARKQSVGVVVGTIGPDGRNVIAHGSFSTTDPRPVDGDTVTTVFTGLLLADMARRGEVSLGDPLARHLPDGITVPERSGKAITLADLATHTSGLPRMPDNLASGDETNPYADYTTEEMLAFVSGYRPSRDIGLEYEHSNVGTALLGQALARRAGKSYEALLQERVVGPLAMRATMIEPEGRLKARMATGHNAALEAVPNWELPAFAGAGALRSSASDLLDFLAMALEPEKTPLAAALADTLAVRRPSSDQQTWAALGWNVTRTSNGEIAWQQGGTGGFSAFIGFHPGLKIGVVVLSNANTGVSDIGLHLLNADMPLTRPMPQ